MILEVTENGFYWSALTDNDTLMFEHIFGEDLDRTETLDHLCNRHKALLIAHGVDEVIFYDGNATHVWRATE